MNRTFGPRAEEGRTVNDLESRAMVLAGMATSTSRPVRRETPWRDRGSPADVLVKGADYSEDQVVGGDLVKSWGGEVKLAPIVEGYSTSAAIARMTEKA